MDHRKLIACLLVMLMPLVTAFMACNGGGGNGDEDADGDAEEDPTGDDTVTDPVPDPSDDDTAGDPIEDPVPDPTDDDGVTPDTVEDPTEDPIEDPTEEEVITELTVEEYCAGQFMTLCAYITACCTTDEADTFTDLDCDDYTNNDGYDQCVESIGGAIDDGTIQFNLTVVAACQSATAALIATCPGYNLFESQFDALGLGPCGEVLEGLVAEDGDCTMSAECAEGYCSGGGADRTCSPFVDTGGDCNRNSQCAPGESCIGDVCAALSGDGGDCDGGGGGDADCQAGFFCDGGSCTAYLATDDNCGFGDECEGMCDTSADPEVCIDFCDGP